MTQANMERAPDPHFIGTKALGNQPQLPPVAAGLSRHPGLQSQRRQQYFLPVEFEASSLDQ